MSESHLSSLVQKSMTSLTPAKQLSLSLPQTSTMSVSIPLAKSQLRDTFYSPPSTSPRSLSPLNKYKSTGVFVGSPPRGSSPQRPVSFSQLDTPRSSPPSSPRLRPTSIDTSVSLLSRLSIENLKNVSSIAAVRPQKRLKSILKRNSGSADDVAQPPSKSKLQFNTTMEHICHFSKNDFPSDIRESPRSTIVDSGDVEATTASAGWEAMQASLVPTWSVISSNHTSIVKMALSDAVQLESARVQGDTLIGGIIVRNYAFEKLVVVRYTIDNWKSTKEVVGDFCNSIKNVSNDPYGLDRFTFSLNLPELFSDSDLSEPITISYAIQFSVASRTYWDNNRGSNYQITIAHNPDGTAPVTTEEPNRWWETSVPRPRLRSRKSGLKTSFNAAPIHGPRQVAMIRPMNTLESNFGGPTTNSRVDDSFAFSKTLNFKRQTPIRPSYTPVEGPFTPNVSMPFSGSPPSYEGSNFGISNAAMAQVQSVTAPVSVPGTKVPKISRLYANDDYFMSSPPSPLVRS